MKYQQYCQMNKRQQNHMDSVDTHIDGQQNYFLSFNSKNLSGSRIEKIDQSSNTDQLLSNCSCDEIPKLKEKAHKSFMQVIQIENLYKEQILQLKQYYEERQKNKEKQYAYKEQLLSDKCKELENEIQKVKTVNKMEKIHEIQIQSYPFSVDNIQSINFNPLDESNQESIYNIKEFVSRKNLQQFTNNLKNQLACILDQIKQTCQKGSKEANLIENALSSAKKIFQFMKDMKEETINAAQKYNEQYFLYLENESKYNKMRGCYESSQKEGKFMADHIKKISSEKIKMEQKLRQSERSNKALQQYVKHIKTIVQEKGLVLAYPNKKQNGLILNKNNSCDDESDISSETLKNIGSGKIFQKNSPILRLSKPSENCQLPATQFRKKNPLFHRQ